MQEWLKVSIILSVFGFLKEIHPSEPYITEYLTGSWRNITEEQVYRDVYPIGTYSYTAQLVIIFLITDFLRYKPLIITIGITGIIIWSMLIWTTSLEALQILELIYGTYMASEVAYFTYIYAKVDKKHYSLVTSHTRAALLAGKLVGSTAAQILLYFQYMDYKELNYITLAAQIMATIWTLFLPAVGRSMYFHREDRPHLPIVSIDSPHHASVQNVTSSSPLQVMCRHLKSAYTNVLVVLFSIWYATAMCGYLQIITYVQVLWRTIEPNDFIPWNGAVDAVLTALGAMCAFAAGFLSSERFGLRSNLIFLATLSALEGGIILITCLTTNIFISYVGFVAFGVLYTFSITVASAEIARHLQADSFGLVFGINTFVALSLQSLLTFIVISKDVLDFGVKEQYIVYGAYFIVIGIIYYIMLILMLVCKHLRGDIK